MNRHEENHYKGLLIIVFAIVVVACLGGLIISQVKRDGESVSNVEDSMNVSNGIAEKVDENETKNEANNIAENKIENTVINKTQTSNNEQEVITDPNGVVYLTFDDGPTASTTPRILDILKE